MKCRQSKLGQGQLEQGSARGLQTSEVGTWRRPRNWRLYGRITALRLLALKLKASGTFHCLASKWAFHPAVLGCLYHPSMQTGASVTNSCSAPDAHGLGCLPRAWGTPPSREQMQNPASRNFEPPLVVSVQLFILLASLRPKATCSLTRPARIHHAAD